MKKRFALIFALLSLLSFGCFGTKSADNTADSQAPAATEESAKAADESAKAADENVPSEYVEISDRCRPNMTEPISAQDWAKANNAFGFKFLRELKGNAVFSPYSIERVLGMTLDGACGETASEMLTALGMPNAKQLSLAGRDVDDAMKAVNKDTMLEIENTLWPDTSLKPLDDYLARVQAGYRTKITKLDYKASPEKARQTINNAVAKATHDRIKDLLPKDSIGSLTRLVLTNSVYFKANWFNQFDEKYTKLEDFHNSKSIVQKPTMHRSQTGMVCIASDYAYYDIRFKTTDELPKGSYIMRIILPTIDGKTTLMADRMTYLEKVENLHADGVNDVKCDTFEVNLSLPKFKLAPNTISIKRHLAKLGMHQAFEEAADFTALSSPELYIDEVYHKAFIEIDEKGGEAAAATAVVMKEKSAVLETIPYYDFKVDHPFIYMIIEESTGAAIFMGRVTDL